jgi:hypothetical protein
VTLLLERGVAGIKYVSGLHEIPGDTKPCVSGCPIVLINSYIEGVDVTVYLQR